MIDKFFGVIPAMATPFTANYHLDEVRARELIEWYLECGVHGISIAGSQGEFFALDERERTRMIEIAVETVNGRVPVYAGTGGVTTDESIRMTRVAETIGADLALIITPYFIQPSQDELVQHFTAIANATKLPVMLYNNPPRTQVNVLPGTLARAMACANIVGIKDSSGDLTQSIEYLLAPPRRALLFAGRDTIALAMMIHGADGTISPAANVFPRLMVRLYDAVKSGNIAEARRWSDVFAPLRAAWAWASFPVVIKEAMALAGHSAGPTRPPISALPDAKRADLKRVVDKILAVEA
jgi:4-hydroxy-tetrahydrodipicolinate synthase